MVERDDDSDFDVVSKVSLFPPLSVADDNSAETKEKDDQ